MGENSRISWTTHTFNPWWGCVEISPACDLCYAREFAVGRFGFDVWGNDKPRKFFGDKHWNEPVRWDRAAKRLGERHRVFAASMADVFEDRRDLDESRERLWKLVEKTTNLDWMLLTKRHDAMAKLLPDRWKKDPLPNVWLGVTAENQRRADERIPALLDVPAAVRWISAEPLLGSIDFSKWHGLDWIIVGGESGSAARRMDPVWAREILDYCRRTGTAYHFKQKGRVLAAEMGCKNTEGKDMSEWPEDLRIQEFPRVAG